jgi:lipoprotein NlpI
MALDDTGYDLTAQLLGQNQQDDPQPFRNYWLHMDGKSHETAAVDRARRFRESQSADGLLRGYRLKTTYYFQ